MSDTPITDENEVMFDFETALDPMGFLPGTKFVESCVARQIERGLNEARAQLDRLARPFFAEERATVQDENTRLRATADRQAAEIATLNDECIRLREQRDNYSRWVATSCRYNVDLARDVTRQQKANRIKKRKLRALRNEVRVLNCKLRASTISAISTLQSVDKPYML